MHHGLRYELFHLLKSLSFFRRSSEYRVFFAHYLFLYIRKKIYEITKNAADAPETSINTAFLLEKVAILALRIAYVKAKDPQRELLPFIGIRYSLSSWERLL